MIPVGELVHIVPVDDLREHEVIDTCWCCADQDEEAENVQIHHSLDRREAYEPDSISPLKKH